MNILINAQAVELPPSATVADAVAHMVAHHALSGPFAVALNLQFVPRAQYAQTPLHEGDALEVIAPVTGG